ncbi:MAG: hypothetical protein Q7N50_13405 [Armatimonadota bacterium]|nr:hypothetical protein [Armatimonadota bacterium]
MLASVRSCWVRGQGFAGSRHSGGGCAALRLPGLVATGRLGVEGLLVVAAGFAWCVAVECGPGVEVGADADASEWWACVQARRLVWQFLLVIPTLAIADVLCFEQRDIIPTVWFAWRVLPTPVLIVVL